MRPLTSEEAALLRRLYRSRKFGGAHLLEENLLRGIPRDRVDDFRRALRALRLDGILQAKATVHGPAVSIPPRIAREVFEELRRHYPDLLAGR